jgi:hypothetical protein
VDTNSEFSILLKNTTGATDEIASVKYGNETNALVTINPSLGKITAPGGLLGKASEAANADTLTTPHEIYVQLNQDRANIDANKIKFDGSTDIGIQVNGILSITHGGTNTDTLTDNRLLYTNTNNNI